MSEEPDPTGVRDLLAGLRDPGPMPDELAERIRRRLADEQHERTGSRAATPLHPRRRTRWVPVLAAAAALVVGGGLAWTTLRPLTGADDSAGSVAESGGSAGEAGDEAADDAAPSSSTASASSTSASSTSTETGSASSTPTQTGSSTQSGDGQARGKAAPMVLMSGDDYTGDRFAAQARRQLSRAVDLSGPIGPSASTGSTGSTGTVDIEHCAARARELSGGRPVLLDVARYDGAPAVVVVTDHAGTRQAWALPTGCDGDPIDAPVRLPY